APFLPYLFYAPSDFALSLWFDGGGALAAGKLSIDAKGNVWSGVNWMPGSQSGIATNLGGGTAKFASDGTALSPAITGFGKSAPRSTRRPGVKIHRLHEAPNSGGKAFLPLPAVLDGAFSEPPVEAIRR